MPEDFELADSMFVKCVDRGLHKRKFFQAGPTPCQILHDVWHSRGLIGNGGFPYLFEIFGKRALKRIQKAYEGMGLNLAAGLIQEAYSLYCISKRASRKGADIREIRTKCDPMMSLLEERYYELEDLRVSKAAEFVRKNF